MRWIGSNHVAEVQGGRGCYGDGEDGGNEGRERLTCPALSPQPSALPQLRIRLWVGGGTTVVGKPLSPQGY
nr:hypothetical protein Itr_chr02CG08750 [Ipomoea trifida]GMC57707.1 hypothetical protein Iba_chr02aCG8230 [Ipomoea batatas]GMC60116.1 hypothetical protein Iba_chr02bCG7760 [Ipomoea batatas]